MQLRSESPTTLSSPMNQATLPLPAQGLPPSAVAQDGTDLTKVDLEFAPRIFNVKARQDAMKEQAAKTEKQIALRRKVWRMVVFITCLAITTVIWFGVTAPFRIVKRGPYHYDARMGLSIEVAACDINFVSGDATTFEYRVIGSGSGIDLRYTQDSTAVTHAIVSNGAGCADVRAHYCKVACELRVTVPSAATRTSFVIGQAAGDKNWPLVHVAPGLIMGSISTLGAPETLSFSIATGATVASLSITLTHGSLYAMHSTIASLNFVSYQAGAAYVIGLTSGTDDVQVTYRQPQNRVCLASDRTSQVSWAPSTDHFAGCDLSALLAGDTNPATNNYYAMTLLRSHYDIDGNSAITSKEFQEGLSNMICCGANCPFTSYCEGQAYKLGYGLGFGAGGTVSNELSARAFAQALIATNQSQWFPNCKTSATFNHLDYTPAATRAISKLHSEKGEVILTLADDQPSSAAPSPPPHQSLIPSLSASLPPTENLTIFSPEGKLGGLRLLDHDAKRLMETYGTDYGDRSATDHIFLIIDVLATPGVPQSRWVFATREVYLALDPALISFLTLGLLTPLVKRERVRFADNDCAMDAGRFSEDARTAQYVRIYEHLHRALHSSGWDTGPLKFGSSLVRLDESSTPSFTGNMGYLGYQLNPATGEREEIVWTSPAVRSVNTAMVLALVIGASVSIAALIVLSIALSRMQQALFASYQANRIVVLRKQGYDPAEQAAIERDQGGEEAQRPPNIWYAPWLSPFKLITAIFVKPLRRKAVHSLDKFVRERLVKTGSLDDFVYLKGFMGEYEIFCIDKELAVIGDKIDVQRALISRHNLRVNLVLARRIYNLRWRNSNEPPEGPPPVEISSLVKVLPPRQDNLKSAPAAATPPAAAAMAFFSPTADSGVSLATVPPGVNNATGKARAAAVSAIISRFVHEKCIVDRTPGTFIDLEPRDGRLGFRAMLNMWCTEHSVGLPRAGDKADIQLPGDRWARALPKKSKFVDGVKARKVSGIRWATDSGQGRLRLSWAFYALEASTVIIHVLVSLLVPIAVIFHSLVLQQLWATLMAPSAGIGGRMPLVWADISSGDWAHVFSLYTVPLMRFLAIEASIFLCATVLRLLVLYTQPKLTCFKSKNLRDSILIFSRYSYMAVLLAHLALFFTYVGNFMAWLVLAAALEPTKFLPYGAAVLVVVVVGVTISRELLAAAKALKTKLKAAFDTMMQYKMKKAIQKVNESIMRAAAEEKRLREEDDDDDQDDTDGSDEDEDKALDPDKEDKPVTPEDIFAAISEGAEELSMEKFEKLFTLLELELSSNQKEQLFGYCDLDCSGLLSEKEFVAGWEGLVQAFLESAADGQGLSLVQIVMVVMYSLTLLALVLTFVLIALSAWRSQTGSSFEATVHAALVSGCGKASAALRKKGAAEEGNVDELVDKIMKEQKDTSSNNEE